MGKKRFIVYNRPSRPHPNALIFMALGLVIFCGGVFAETEQDLPPATALKKLSVEELMDIDVPPHVDRVLSKPPKLHELRATRAELTAGVVETLQP